MSISSFMKIYLFIAVVLFILIFPFTVIGEVNSINRNLKWSVEIYANNRKYIEVIVDSRDMPKETYLAQVKFEVEFFDSQKKYIKGTQYSFTDYGAILKCGDVYKRYFEYQNDVATSSVKGKKLKYKLVVYGLNPIIDDKGNAKILPDTPSTRREDQSPTNMEDEDGAVEHALRVTTGFSTRRRLMLKPEWKEGEVVVETIGKLYPVTTIGLVPKTILDEVKINLSSPSLTVQAWKTSIDLKDIEVYKQTLSEEVIKRIRATSRAIPFEEILKDSMNRDTIKSKYLPSVGELIYYDKMVLSRNLQSIEIEMKDGTKLPLIKENNQWKIN